MSLFYSRILWFFSGIGLILCSALAYKKTTILIELVFYSFNSVQFAFPFILDVIRVIFFSIVALISANVLQLSNLYMEDEVYVDRFIYLVLLLIGSIAAFIFIPHITALLLGWDGLGLVSFLLVTFYASPKSLSAGIFTALSNRIGDALILIRISLMYELSYHLDTIRFIGQPVGGLLLIVAAMTKRAQLPFSGWLPAAMEAPTPVSALVHSSTLVTAGVYLIIRFYPFLRNSFFFNKLILSIGAITRLFAGMRAMVELDLKKIIALSTLSQLGLILMRIGLGFPFLAFFHLIAHAMFKALLLICAGCLIHLHGHAQDIRQIGGVRDQFPVIISSFSLSRFALCAVPFIAGFYSKDAILEAFFFSPLRIVVVIVAIRSTFFTRIYSARLIVNALFSSQKSPRSSRFCEPIVLPIVTLSLGAILGGSVITCRIGPLAFESFRPFPKILLAFLLFFGPILVLISRGTKRFNFWADLSKAYCSAGRGMFFLTPLVTQKVLYTVNGPSRSLCHFDQSWLEKGQIEILRSKRSGFINIMVRRGLLITVGVLRMF